MRQWPCVRNSGPRTAEQGQVEFLDPLEEREVRAPDGVLDPGLGAVRDLLGHEHGEEVAIAEALGFGAVHQLGIQSPRRRQVQPPEERVDPEGRRQILPQSVL